MTDTPLAYEAATAFRRVRSERRVHGLAVALFLGMMTYCVLFGRLFAGRAGWMGRVFLGGALALLTFFWGRGGGAMLRSRGGWEPRTAGDRLYPRLPREAREQSVGLPDGRHVRVAK